MLNLQDTDDVVTTLSAAGYPLVLLETVGLGQSEVEVAQSVDILILLLPPGGGDGKCYFNNPVCVENSIISSFRKGLQGIKKGIVEMAHILAVTKADGNLLEAAKSTAADYRGALSVLQQNGSNSENIWKPPVLMTSSATKVGLDDLWNAIQDYKNFLIETERWEPLRQQQAKYWMWKQFTRLMQDRMKRDPELGERAQQLESDMLHGDLTPRIAAQELLDGVFGLITKK
jgi:LAO/AO transport system kinase